MMLKLTKINMLHNSQTGFHHLLALMIIVVGFGIAGTYLLVSSRASTTRVYDISHPQCGEMKKSLKEFKAGLGIVGLNGGTPKKANPCFKQQWSRFSTPAIYINTSYTGEKSRGPLCNDRKSAVCNAQNTGYKHAAYSLKLAKRKVGPQTLKTTWWIDVETENAWGTDKQLNVEYLRGIVQTLRDAGVTYIGFYSTSYQWGLITGGWQSNMPVWFAAGESNNKDIQAAAADHDHCDRGFTGGKVWMVQHIGRHPSGLELDVNYVCGDAF
jgi:hypothetical protein